MAWYDAFDYVPIVSNVKGAVQGNWDQAAWGQFDKVAKKAGIDIPDVSDLGGFGGSEQIDTKPVTDAAARNQALLRGVIDERNNYVNRPAPRVAGPNLQQQDATRNNQNALVQALQAQAAGKAPSAADLQARRDSERVAANQYALAAALQGRNPGAALRQASTGAAEAQASISAQGAIRRAQEQAQAQQALGAVLQGVRAQDQSAQQQVMQAQVANVDAQLRARGLDDVQRNALLSAILGLSGQDASLASAQINAQTQAAQLQNQANAANQQMASSGAMAYAAYASDRNEKKSIRKADDEVEALLEALKPYSYDYRRPDEPGQSHGRKLGIMVQDAEKSEAGRRMTTKLPNGTKGIDIPAALGAALASAANLHGRLKKLEGR